MIKEFSVKTNRRNEFVDITHKIESLIGKTNEGTVTIFVPHTTAALTINENADRTVKSDLLRKLSGLIPEHDNYDHAEGNSDSHLKASLFGNSLTIIIKNNKLLLGTWQSIYFCEFDGPRNRKVLVNF